MIPRGMGNSAPVLAILRALVEERIGLSYSRDDEPIFLEKLTARAETAGFQSLLDYYYYLRYDPNSAAELDALTDALVVQESYLYREYEQLRFAVDGVMAPACAGGKKPRVWSAACALGEEPVTLALMLARRGLLDRVELVASDISTRAIARARAGEYGLRALRAVPDIEQPIPWLSTENGRPRIDSYIRDAVGFHKLNLLDADAIDSLGAFDVIFCRNVLIYFAGPTVEQVLERLYGALVPGGILFVGISESLLCFQTRFVCEERSGIFYYRRPT